MKMEAIIFTATSAVEYIVNYFIYSKKERLNNFETMILGNELDDMKVGQKYEFKGGSITKEKTDEVKSLVLPNKSRYVELEFFKIIYTGGENVSNKR